MPRLLTVCFIVTVLLSAAARVALADPIDDEARRIGKQLQCPVCSGASVAESPSELAGQMRTVIRAKLEAGESEQQIVGYFVDRYGDSVLIEPPRRGVGMLVWVAPVAMLAIGAVVLWRLLKIWLRPRQTSGMSLAGQPTLAHRNGTGHAADDSPSSSVDRARGELDRFRREA